MNDNEIVPGMVFQDTGEVGGLFLIGEDGDYWLNEEVMIPYAPRSRSHGYAGCVYVGTLKELVHGQ